MNIGSVPSVHNNPYISILLIFLRIISILAFVCLSIYVVQAQNVTTIDEGLDNMSIGTKIPGTWDFQLLKNEAGRNTGADVNDIEIVSHTIKPGESVWSVLVQNGFQPNHDLLNTVEYINWNKADLNNIHPDEVIMVPAVSQRLRSLGHDDYIMVDIAWREGLASPINKINTQMSFVQGNLNSDLISLKNSLQVIEENRDILSGDFIGLIREQTELARQMQLLFGQSIQVSDTLIDNNTFGTLQTASVDVLRTAYSTINSDINRASEAVSSGKKTSQVLEVFTIDETTGERRCHISVFWTPEAYFQLGLTNQNKTRLTSLSTPASGKVPLSQIRIWGEWLGGIISNQEYIDLYAYDDIVKYDLLVRNGSVECN